MHADTDKLLGIRRPAEKWRAILLRDPCAYCGCRSAYMTLDHVVARSSGTKKSAGVENAAPACFDCNQHKGDTALLRYLVDNPMRRTVQPAQLAISFSRGVRQRAHLALGTVPRVWWQAVADFVATGNIASGATWRTIPLTSVDGVALRLRLKVHVCVGADGRPARVKFLRFRGPEIEGDLLDH